MAENKIPLFVCGKDNRPMVKIPAGKFLYGEDKEEVETPEFFIDLYPVTNAEYKKFVDATGCEPPASWRNGTWPAGKENHPVVEVNFDSASAYAAWAGKRLPTNHEWEKPHAVPMAASGRGEMSSTAISATLIPVIPLQSANIHRQATALTAVRIWPATFGNGSAAANLHNYALRYAAATGWTVQKKLKPFSFVCILRIVKIHSSDFAVQQIMPNQSNK
jgi:hypothetical protein